MPYLRDPTDSEPGKNDTQSVAVIGLSCRFPGDATNSEKFWDLLCNGRSAYSESNRFNVDAFHSKTKGKINTSTPRGGHFLSENVAAFDANFFSISQIEAMAMDPQQRLMLEVAYEAFENAGLPLETVAGTDTSCYIGNFVTDYREMLFRDPESAPLYSMSGSGQELIANRVSWFYDLRGPSFTLGTACSSSLVALHQGCQSLRTKEANMAIVGGSNLLLNPDMFMVLSNQQFLAQDGRCKSFDARGDGYGRGEGFAAVVLKRVDDAIRDGDPIRAVIRGTGVNQDGKTKGITVPNADAQADLIRSTYRSAGIEFKDTHYFEAHGTGTKAGDPLELEGISKTLGSVRKPGNKILVGSVKANIGHLEATAGMAGLIKSIYILENAMIPPNINFHQPNPRIPFDEWKIQIPTKVTPWPVDGLRRLSVQGFGYGGTNAHAILDDAFHYLAERKLRGIHFSKPSTSTQMRNGYPPSLNNFPTKHAQGSLNLHETELLKRSRLFVFSAQDQDGLKRQREVFSQYLSDRADHLTDNAHTADLFLRDLAFTLSERRSQLAWKTYLTASSVDELISGLENKESSLLSFRSSSEPRVGFIFTGQGAQWARMGIELFQYPVFRESVANSDEFLRSGLGCTWSANEEMRRDESDSNINLPAYSQPICTVLQLALVDLLESWNIVPSAMAGHSSGEIAGAYCLGALSKEDALRVAYYRGLLSSQMKKISPSLQGAMMAVGASESQAQSWIDRLSRGDVVVACVNSPSSVTISGDVSGIDELEAILKQEGIFARKLKVETAYHSPHMDTISMAYLEAMRDVQTQPERESRRMHSAVSGSLVDSSELGAINWVRNLVSPVLFYDALHDLLRPMQGGRRSTETTIDILLEIGPHGTLQGAMNQTMKKHGISGVDCRSILSRGKNGVETTLAAAGALFAHGVRVDISQANNESSEASTSPPRPLVDLPSYTWNHSRTFWSESRLSQQYRFREWPRSSLLGAPCPIYGETERLWRGFLRVSEEPWIRDHKIQMSILYPAAGYIAMAIEAACQIAAKGKVVRDFKLRDIQIIAPAVMTEDSDLEAILQLRPHLIGTRDNASTWYEFTVSTCSNGEDLRTNCYGLLLIDYQSAQDTGVSNEREMEDQAALDLYRQSEKLCETSEDPKAFYKELAAMGLNYGPAFQNISRIQRGHGHSCCDVDITDPSLLAMSGQIDRPHVIHPSNLDAMFHAVFAAFKDQKGQMKEVYIPKSIDEMTISANIPFAVGTRFKGFSTASKHGFRELMADLVMLDESLTRPVVTVKGFCGAAISRTNEGADEVSEASEKSLFSKMVWKPAIELLTPDQQRELVEMERPGCMTPRSVERLEKSDMLAFFYIRHALEQLPVDMTPPPRRQALYNWMQEQLTVSDTQAQPSQSLGQDCTVINEKTAKSVEDEVETYGAEGQTLCCIGRNLEKIVLGKADPTRLMLQEGLMDRFYEELRGMEECYIKMSELVKLMAHSKPDLSILEAGFSKGGAVSYIMSATSEDANGVSQTFEYIFTSPDDESLKQAQAILEPWKDRLSFKTLYIEKNPSSQGFEDGCLDVIIMSGLLEAAQNPNRALTNARKLLKPGGKIFLVNITKPGIRLSIVLRCLRSEREDVPDCDNMDGKAFDALLRRNDFTPDFIASDYEGWRNQQLSFVVATAGSTSAQDQPRDLELVILEAPHPSPRSKSIAAQLAIALESNTIRAKRATWDNNVFRLKGKTCIFLLELESPFILNLGKDDFAAIKQLVVHTSSLLWVTALDDPAGSIASGMARSIRNEIPGKEFRTLRCLAKSLDSPERLASLIGKLAISSTSDNEFVEEDGLLKICRVAEDTAMNEEIPNWLSEGKDSVELLPLEQIDGPYRLAIRAQGMLDTLCLEPDDVAALDLSGDEVEIDVKATGMNFRDVMVAMGQIPDSLLGFEASGTISRVGQNVTRFKIGDAVCTLGHGCHRTLFRNKASFCQLIPDGISFEEAATLPLVHCTAFYALARVARVQKGQTVLIHAAAGGVGQSAIQIAKYYGLEIFATVGSPDKKQLVQEVYGIPDDHIFNSRDLSFAKGVLRMTNGRGVDCIINSLAGEALRQTWRCIAPFGHFVEIGMKDILGNTGLEMRPFMQDASFTFFNLKHMMTDRPELMAEIIEETFEFLRQGIIRPFSPLTVYPVSEMENAFRLMSAGKHRGKIALTWTGKDIVVPVTHHHKSLNNVKLDDNATYVLVGGLGGLGRSLSNLLVDLGARHLCFISRSGSKSSEAQKTLRLLESQRIKVSIFSCDIASKKNLAETLNECSLNLPPIKGVFQCAMVLRDVLFEKMTYQQWTESLSPKVQGSWNLHTLLPKDLDFFITLSSFAGIFGNRTQSNYAAAGAYQDALAYHRRAHGLKAVTIDLGIIRDVGVIAEQGATDYLKEWEEPFGIRETEFHLLITKTIANELDDSISSPPQILTGFATGRTAQAAGIRRPFYFDDPRFSILAKSGLGTHSDLESNTPHSLSLREQLAQSSSIADAIRAVTDALVTRTAKSLQTERTEIDENRPLHSYGVDSLVAVEIANWVHKEAKVTVSVFDVLATMPIVALAGKIATKSPFFVGEGKGE